ncbi:hypothetical protein DMN91_005847, partial [Ooceraea biroi]
PSLTRREYPRQIMNKRSRLRRTIFELPIKLYLPEEQEPRSCCQPVLTLSSFSAGLTFNVNYPLAYPT